MVVAILGLLIMDYLMNLGIKPFIFILKIPGTHRLPMFQTVKMLNVYLAQ